MIDVLEFLLLTPHNRVNVCCVVAIWERVVGRICLCLKYIEIFFKAKMEFL